MRMLHSPSLNAACLRRLPQRNPKPGRALQPKIHQDMEAIMRGALLWLVGLPIPIIIALYLFGIL